MGKKSRDSGGSRATLERGGVRNAGVVRDVSRNINRERAYQMAQPVPDLDLSAFTETPVAISQDDFNRPSGSLRPANLIVRPGQGRQALNNSATAQRPALLARPPRIMPTPVLAQRPGPAKQAHMAGQSKPARSDHLPAPQSEKRKEKPRANCKQRPEPTKSRGTSGSRSFVPWCKT